MPYPEVSGALADYPVWFDEPAVLRPRCATLSCLALGHHINFLVIKQEHSEEHLVLHDTMVAG